MSSSIEMLHQFGEKDSHAIQYPEKKRKLCLSFKKRLAWRDLRWPPLKIIVLIIITITITITIIIIIIIIIIQPSNHPTIQPSNHPTIHPSNHPTIQPSNHPTKNLFEDRPLPVRSPKKVTPVASSAPTSLDGSRISSSSVLQGLQPSPSKTNEGPLKISWKKELSFWNGTRFGGTSWSNW